ncbi:hypothetical protein [Allomuricauda sp. SCSIO 65647]|uniref:hypothetical protein n=1 Tax=Allomuricauda sp. SCSIO 65647 TaxID=2908843 RepID=UPI001F3ADFA6|nr:hypothetical protein [Muricauda sp. SCSIO 65647]UJH68740.1 hypothetical protein L0P89_05870 [Muricauda sp. SCSIO 65647]
MLKFRVILLLFLALMACKDDKRDLTSAQQTDSGTFNHQRMPSRIEINTKASAILDQWEAFGNFSRSFDILYRARNNEDLILALDDLLEKEKLLAASEYPETFNRAQVKSRQKVVRTFLLKARAQALERRDATESIIEMFKAYNAYRNQFNILVNNPLDSKLILDEG